MAVTLCEHGAVPLPRGRGPWGLREAPLTLRCVAVPAEAECLRLSSLGYIFLAYFS